MGPDKGTGRTNRADEPTAEARALGRYWDALQLGREAEVVLNGVDADLAATVRNLGALAASLDASVLDAGFRGRLRRQLVARQPSASASTDHVGPSVAPAESLGRPGAGRPRPTAHRWWPPFEFAAAMLVVAALLLAAFGGPAALRSWIGLESNDRSSDPAARTAATGDAVASPTAALSTAGGWSTELGDRFVAPPVVDGDTVYVVGNDDASGSGVVAALDAAYGTLRWLQWTDGSVTVAPAVANGMVFAAGSTQLHAFDAETGTPRWQHVLIGRYIAASPVVLDDLVYVVVEFGGAVPGPVVVGPPGETGGAGTVFVGSSATGRLVAIEVATGLIRWDVPRRAPTGDGVLAFDATTGEQRWFLSDPYPLTALAYGDGGLHVGTRGAAQAPDGNVVSVYDVAGGAVPPSPRGRASFDAPPTAILPFAREATLVATGEAGRGALAMVDFTTGTTKWQVETPGAIADGLGPDGVGAILAATDADRLVAVDGSTGTLLWDAPLGEPGVVEHVTVDQRYVYVAAETGTVARLYTGSLTNRARSDLAPAATPRTATPIVVELRLYSCPIGFDGDTSAALQACASIAPPTIGLWASLSETSASMTLISIAPDGRARFEMPPGMVVIWTGLVAPPFDADYAIRPDCQDDENAPVPAADFNRGDRARGVTFDAPVGRTVTCRLFHIPLLPPSDTPGDGDLQVRLVVCPSDFAGDLGDAILDCNGRPEDLPGRTALFATRRGESVSTGAGPTATGVVLFRSMPGALTIRLDLPPFPEVIPVCQNGRGEAVAVDAFPGGMDVVVPEDTSILCTWYLIPAASTPAAMPGIGRR